MLGKARVTEEYDLNRRKIEQLKLSNGLDCSRLWRDQYWAAANGCETTIKSWIEDEKGLLNKLSSDIDTCEM